VAAPAHDATRLDPQREHLGCAHPGFILSWRRQSYRWSALVLYVQQDKERGERYVQQWFPAERLRPLKADPNERP
jgi:hypothetical protein